MIDLSTPEERMATAGEYVLGTLDDADREAFAAAMAQDESLLAEVYAWQDRLLGLSRQAAPAEPTPQLWQRVSFSVEALSPSPPPVASKPGPTRARWWQRPGPWQGIGGSAVAAALLMGVLLVQRLNEPPQVRYLAVLQSPDDKSNGWLVEVAAGRTLRLVPVAGTPAATGPVPAGKALQFWTKPQGAAGPTSLGLVRAGQTVELPVSRLPGVGEQQLFEITLEPENGSPIGRPTGPILYVGRTLQL